MTKDARDTRQPTPFRPPSLGWTLLLNIAWRFGVLTIMRSSLVKRTLYTESLPRLWEWDPRRSVLSANVTGKKCLLFVIFWVFQLIFKRFRQYLLLALFARIPLCPHYLIYETCLMQGVDVAVHSSAVNLAPLVMIVHAAATSTWLPRLATSQPTAVLRGQSGDSGNARHLGT